MKRFKSILYFADGASETCPALNRALALARSNEARLTLFDVIGERLTGAEIQRRVNIDVGALVRERRQEELERLAAPVREPQCLIYTQVVSGVPFVEVIRAVLRNGYDLVIKPARPPEGLSERIFGSTDLHLLRKCPCPVWIDRPGETYHYRQVLAAVDPTDEEGIERLVMDLATSLAERESARLAVIHAWALQGESLLRGGRSPMPPQEVDRLAEEQRLRHKARLEALLADYGMTLDHPQVALVKGNAAQAIREQAEALGADLIVMGTVGRTGIPGFFIGNTAEDVLQTCRTSILAVKPAGFVSPVTL